MKGFRQPYARPALWGVFFFGAVVLGLVLVRVGWMWTVESDWDTWQEARMERDADLVIEQFQMHAQRLYRVAEGVKSDNELVRCILSDDRLDAARAFERLESHRRDDRLSLAVFDPRGTPIAWSGRGLELPSEEAGEFLANDSSLLAIVQRDLHTYLIAAVKSSDGSLWIACAEPFEVNYPISNRFISQVSFARSISEIIGRPVRLILGSVESDLQGDHYRRVALTKRHGEVLAIVLVPLPSPEFARQMISESIWPILSAAAGFGIFSLALVLLSLASAVRFRWTQPLTAPLAFLGVRYAWLALGFPGATIGGDLFDPARYGSTFGGGLAASPGETLISILLAFASLSYAYQKLSAFFDGARQTPGDRSNRLGRLLVVLSLFILLAGLTRMYGAAIRSFHFDSTIWYNDPTRLLPPLTTGVMHLNALLLTIGLLMIASLVVRVSWIQAGRAGALGSSNRWLLLSLLFVVAWVAFSLFDHHSQVPWVFPLVVYGSGSASLIVSRRLQDSRMSMGTSSLLSLGMLIILSFVGHALALNFQSHRKDEQDVESLAKRLVRPADSWLSFVVSDGLQAIVAEFDERKSQEGGLRETSSGDALALWAETLMSREGYNSGVFLYDAAGELRSKFSVGLTTYEETEFLRRLYEYDEEMLQVVERRTPTATIKYYGIWGTIRNEQGQLHAIVSLMLSASPPTFFRGDVNHPLSRIDESEWFGRLRDIIVTEYQDNALTATSDNSFAAGMPLDEKVREMIRTAADGKAWHRLTSGDRSFKTLFVEDRSTPGRIVAVSLEEPTLRWHVSNLARLFLIYALLSVVLGAVRMWRRRSATGPRGFGFRTKLIAAFALLSIAPLFLLAYYNTQFAVERLESSIDRELSQHLDLVHRRMLGAISSELDFQEGITNDFCDILASELGIDLSVYGRSYLQASSRPELYAATILDPRLPADAYANLFVLGRTRYIGQDRVGETDYAVGYQTIVIDGRTLGVIAVPTLFRQAELEIELVERNVFFLSIYIAILVLVVGTAIVLAYTLAGPIRVLTRAAREIGEGNLDIQVAPRSRDEIGELVEAFNEMTAEIKESRFELAKAEREMAWKEMAKQVAHEIRNPLTPMKLSIQHLRQAFKDKVSNFDEIVQTVSQTVMEQIDALTRIASEFSQFARMPQRRFEHVKVNRVLQETIDLFREVKEIEFESNFADTDPDLVADRDELRRVFINVVRNAIQAMEGGGTIVLSSETHDRACIIRIQDSGPGIPEPLLARVFEPNFSTKSEGMGLGLAIAKKIIEDLNGSITITSKVGVGTTIEITLPVKTHA